MAQAAPRIPFDVVDETVNLIDTEAEPWSIQLEASVPARLDEPKLRSAVREALMRHPMGRARRVAAKRRSEHRYYWEITPEPALDPLTVVECPDGEALAAARSRLQSLPVPLAESPPLRIRLARGPTGDVVMLNVNHAASDGIGGLRFLQSVARAYAREPDPLPELDPLQARDLTAIVGTGERRTQARRAVVLAEKARDLLAPPARIAPEGGREEPGYGFQLLRMSASESAAVTDGEHPGTANDLLLAALHLTIAAWNNDHGARSRRIGVMVPVNLRPAEWQGEVMGNLLLPIRVSTDTVDRSSPDAALETIVRQTRQLKQRATAPALVELLRRFHGLPLWAKEAASPVLRLGAGRLADTAMLSNLGRVDDPPTFGEEPGTAALWFSPPARMPLGLSLGVVTVEGGLQLALRYRHPLFGISAAARFAECYLSTLERSASGVTADRMP
jgi:NRPS condensation-like uncharacterized protein